MIYLNHQSLFSSQSMYFPSSFFSNTFPFVQNRLFEDSNTRHDFTLRLTEKRVSSCECVSFSFSLSSSMSSLSLSQCAMLCMSSFYFLVFYYMGGQLSVIVSRLLSVHFEGRIVSPYKKARPRILHLFISGLFHSSSFSWSFIRVYCRICLSLLHLLVSLFFEFSHS